MILFFRRIRVLAVSVLMMAAFGFIQPVCGQNADHMMFLNPLPVGNTINDAWSPDGDNFYFAGDGGTIIFFDGSDFTIMPTPTDHALYGIHGTSINDIWAVGGNYYSEVQAAGRSVILHYDGSEWTAQTPPADTWDQYFVFSDVWCDGGGTIWAVTRSTTAIARTVGGAWEYVDTGVYSDYGFHAVYGFSATDFYAAGECGHILHYDNGDWSLEREEEDGGCDFSSNDLLYDVWGPDADNVFVTGNASQVLNRKSDGAWETVYSGSIFYDASKYSISGSSETNMYFAGAGGELDHWNGSTYTRLFDSGSDNSQNIIVSDGIGGYYIGMDYGKISGFDGAERTPLTVDIASGKNWQFAQRAQRIWLCPGEMDTGDKIYAWNGSKLSAIDPGWICS
ncbi:MAG: hypothetical protein U5L07_14635 [Desulfobacterales bacterium]|nr:hypothetical protein [Desulfobacterales bacterium]